MLPKVELGEVSGLIKEVRSYENQIDIATVADELVYDIDELFPVIDTAEALGFIEVKDGKLKLTEVGNKFLDCKYDERSKIVRQQLLNNKQYKSILDEIKKRGEVTKEELKEIIRTIETSDEETLTSITEKFIYYGVYSDLLEYNSRSNIIRLYENSK
ncbi:MAG: AAA-associated domain-containing protein [Thermoproteota archaeon]|nr:AAA-associated domain-containing protein [Candidatus Brockarchaeota archaeon]MBO3762982.1 AAA-associated domain-containing protein [Candidatus Brockarchaeota archaeon]MBO3768198.1 AAA-associated domain-containing protein [Candidatus Brockarchaeota archaeon]MBO3801654.1 AAA-associated domain-containing protein [Candidatus Brockarchaeota archaeon]